MPHPYCTENVGKTREITDLPKITQPELRLYSDSERKAVSAHQSAEICDVQSGRMARNSTIAPFVRCVSTLSSKKYYLNNQSSFKHIISFVFTASEVGRPGVVTITRQKREVRILGGDMPPLRDTQQNEALQWV